MLFLCRRRRCCCVSPRRIKRDGQQTKGSSLPMVGRPFWAACAHLGCSRTGRAIAAVMEVRTFKAPNRFWKEEPFPKSHSRTHHLFPRSRSPPSRSLAHPPARLLSLQCRGRLLFGVGRVLAEESSVNVILKPIVTSEVQTGDGRSDASRLQIERGTHVIQWRRLKKRRGGNEKTRGELVKGGGGIRGDDPVGPVTFSCDVSPSADCVGCVSFCFSGEADTFFFLFPPSPFFCVTVVSHRQQRALLNKGLTRLEGIL